MPVRDFLRRLFARGFAPATPRFHAALRRHLAAAAAHPMYETWWAYASSTLRRGTEAVATIERFGRVRGTRCLDVGSAYGGFPLACLRAGATEAVGLEIDPDLLAVARALAADLRRAVDLRQGDATDPAAVAALGTFDRITCNDVIEHVGDPHRLADHLAALLRPGGLLFLEAPNKDCLDAVLRDGHYGLFGLTLLARAPAERYYRQAFPEPYTVGEYLTLAEYLTMLGGRGVDAYHLNWTAANEADLGALRARMAELERTGAASVAGIPATDASRADVAGALADYLAGYAALEGRRAAAVSPAERAKLGREVTLTYLSYMWQMVGVRGAVAASPDAWADRGEAAALARL